MSLYRLSAKEPDSKAIYRSLMDGYGDQYDKSVGGRIEGLCFMYALGIARARKRIQQARDQRLPNKVVDLIERREAELGIVPGPHDTMAQRRAVLVERFKPPTGGCRLAIETALTAAIGADFIKYYVRPIGSEPNHPANAGDWPMNFQRNDVPRKIVKLDGPVAFTGVPVTVQFEQLGGTPALIPGDVVVFDAGREGQADRVTISAITDSTGAFDETIVLLTATFTRPHEAGAFGFTHPFPLWRSTRREAIIVVSAAAAQDPEKRRKVHDEMRRHARAVSVWNIVAANGTNTQEFQLGTACMGFSTLPAIAY